MAADATSALTHWGTSGLRYINADYTLSLTRLPEGPHIGLAALLHSSHDGVASGPRRSSTSTVRSGTRWRWPW